MLPLRKRVRLDNTAVAKTAVLLFRPVATVGERVQQYTGCGRGFRSFSDSPVEFPLNSPPRPSSPDAAKLLEIGNHGTYNVPPDVLFRRVRWCARPCRRNCTLRIGPRRSRRPGRRTSSMARAGEGSPWGISLALCSPPVFFSSRFLCTVSIPFGVQSSVVSSRRGCPFKTVVFSSVRVRCWAVLVLSTSRQDERVALPC